MKPTAAASRPCVTLVGAGPGDAELLTIKAVKALRRATVALVDDLVSADVLAYLRRSARVIHVGKRGGCRAAAGSSPALPAARGGGSNLGRPVARPSTPQAFIHKLMVAEALRGERVVRVKGGDPFVFGRGGEEVDALRAAGVDVEVIGGLTAGIAGPAAIGIPVTDRRYAPGVALVTGHARDGGVGPDWAALAKSRLTLVIYMGVSQADGIVAALLAAGMPGRTPAAVVSAATTAWQRHAVCTLGSLVSVMQDDALASPAVLVIGDVVAAAPAVRAVLGPVDDGTAEPLARAG